MYFLYVVSLTFVILTTKGEIYKQFPRREWVLLGAAILIFTLLYLAAVWVGSVGSVGSPDSGARLPDTSTPGIISIRHLDHLGWWEVEFSKPILCVGSVRMEGGSQSSEPTQSCTGTPTLHLIFEFPQSLEPGEYINEVRVSEGGRIVGFSLDERAADLDFSPVRVPEH